MMEIVWYAILTISAAVGILGALLLLLLGASEPSLYSNSYPFAGAPQVEGGRGKMYRISILACLGWIPFFLLYKKVDHTVIVLIPAIILDVVTLVISECRGRARSSEATGANR